MRQRIKKHIIILAFLLGAGAVIAAVTGCESFFNDLAGDPYRIVFTSNMHGGNTEIYIMNADGSEQTRLTFDLANSSGAKPSPDGSQIVFTKALNIWTMDADGSNQKLISANGSAAPSPAWSPDGRSIVYAANDNSLRIMNAENGSDYFTLIPLATQPNTASWSGKRDLVAYRAFTGTDFDIYIVAPYSGAPVTSIIANAANDETTPSWSPDGAKLAYSKSTAVGSGVYDIYMWDFATNTGSLLYDSGSNDDCPSFSPDGEKIVFNSNVTGSNQIYVINADGTGVQQLTYSGTNTYPFWVP